MPTFSQELFDSICDELARGLSLREICQRDDMPSTTSVKNWLAKSAAGDGQIVAQYARAREQQADYYVDEILDIADNAENDWMRRHGKDDGDAWQVNGEHLQRSRLRIDSRKWIASKLAPKKYGEKLDLNHGGDININIPARTREL